MSLFGKKKEESNGCCCGGNCNSEQWLRRKNQNRGCCFKILGSGCKKCNELEANTVEALKQLGMDTHVDHVLIFHRLRHMVLCQLLHLSLTAKLFPTARF
jgi:hypothetical protein